MRNDELYRALWEKTFSLLKKRWFYFLRISAVFFVPLYILDTYFWQNTRLIREVINRFSLKIFFIVDDIIKFIMIAVFILYIVALLIAIHSADQDKKSDVGSAYKGAFDMLGPYLLVSALFVLKVSVRSLLFLIPGIVAGAYYGFAGSALLVDQKRGSAALLFSRNIVEPKIKQYLAYVSLSALCLLAVCAVGIFLLDTLVVFYQLKYEWLIAGIIDCAEAGWLAFIVVLWQIFYYYLYQEFKTAAQEMS